MGTVIEPSPVWDVIIANIRQILRDKKLTAEGVSLAAKAPANYLSRILSRKIKRPRVPMLMRLAAAMGVTLADLTEGDWQCPVKLHERIRWLRESRGWERAELAERSGVPRDTIDDLENNQIVNPKIPMLHKLATALSVRLYDLLGDHSLTPSPWAWKAPNPTVQLRGILTDLEQVHRDFEADKINERQLYARSARLLDQARQLGKMLPHGAWPGR